MDLFGREAPKLPDYSITRRGRADGGSGRRGRRAEARFHARGMGGGGSRGLEGARGGFEGAPVVKPTLRDVGDARSNRPTPRLQ